MNPTLALAINRYPLLIPRIYNYLRLAIMPLEEIAAVVPTTSTILDVGCGYGLLDIYLAETSPNRTVIGSELNSKRVRIAQKISQDLENVKFFEENLLHPDRVQNIDCILLIDLLHHVSYEQQSELLATIYSLLPNGGTLIIKDLDNRPAFKYYWNLIHDKLVTGFDRLYFSSALKQRKNIEFLGFKITDYSQINHPFYAHYLMVARKM
jgi:cyclopropane fatty-acyl-phospholipid synthase-like methyltransferase